MRWEYFQIRSKLRFSINHAAMEINNNHLVLVIFVFHLVVYSHCLSPESGRIGCMALCRTFHTAPEQGQGRMGYVPIFQVLKLFQVVFQLYFNGFRVSSPGPRHSQHDKTLIPTEVSDSESEVSRFLFLRFFFGVISKSESSDITISGSLSFPFLLFFFLPSRELSDNESKSITTLVFLVFCFFLK